MSLLRRASGRHLTRHAGQTALAVLGVGLGVAVVLAVDLAVSSARRGFTVSAETVAGRATHQAVAGPRGLADAAYPRVRDLPGVLAAAPAVEGTALVGSPGVVVRVLGLDPLAEGSFRRFTAGAAGGGAAPRGPSDGGPADVGMSAAVLIGARAGLVSVSTAADLGIGSGDWLQLEVGGRPDSVLIVGLLQPRDDPGRIGLRNLLIVDVGTAQTLFGRTGLDRIDLILDDAEPGARERVLDALPPGVVVREAGAAAGAFREMTRAFDLNLRALSLLALIFGIFLIYNSVTFSVVQRRRLLGTLRAIGATRGQIFGIVQAEALLMGAAGAAIGIVLGILLGQGLVRLVTRTITDLYFVVTVRELIVAPATVARAAALGIAGTLLAALPAAAEAAGTHPRSALIRSELESGLRRRLPLISIAGLAMAAAGGLVLALSTSVDASFAGLFGVILGMALLTPLATLVLVGALKPVAGRIFGVIGRMAAGGVTAGLSRTAPAMAALTVAVATTIGVAIMVGSFRDSLIRWLDLTLSADLYIAPAGSGGSGPAGAVALDPTVLDRIAAEPGVAEVRRYRRVHVQTPEGPVDLMAIGVDSRLRDQFDFLDGGGDSAWSAFVAGRALLASEPFAHHHGVVPGDRLPLQTAAGTVDLPIAAIFRDYGSDRGMLMMAHDPYQRLWHDSTITTVALILEAGSDPGTVARQILEATAPIQPLAVRSEREVAQASLIVFDRTFAITDVLRLLALIVAFVGVFSALMALQLERARELGVLRATGLTPGQVWAMVASQTGLMGFVAGILSIPMGLLLAVLMIEFINRRSFGWTMDLSIPTAALIQAVVLAITASLLAGLYPAWRMARTSPAEALRGE